MNTTDQQRLICPTCGACFDADQQRQHTDWHVDQRMKRLQPDPEAAFWMSELNTRLNQLEATEQRRVRHAPLPGVRDGEAGR